MSNIIILLLSLIVCLYLEYFSAYITVLEAFSISTVGLIRIILKCAYCITRCCSCLYFIQMNCTVILVQVPVHTYVQTGMHMHAFLN